MRLTNDYTHPTPGEGLCRVRVYAPEENTPDEAVVVLTELPRNAGRSVTNAAGRLAAEVMAAHGLERPVIIEHYPAEARPPLGASYDLVTFPSYRPRQTTDIDGWCWTLEAPKWSPLGRDMAEAMVGQLID